ncbi:ABC transporter ATP-binding protein [Natranaerobius thermophilus]|uniref:Oligopeptide/dipeptide ABC transporter, ATPase subunit n=1 Tax=Natranaerobius thermophilus (strain ATCC BAA-1301 / DSM 18059 / JW/NM-WN-LF) TaxID=457570 RepID=B2A5R4_NATTJ|nr:dipeptide ABC transporter ATP-binding protein [Natranaerobius thermophilus]ACB84077.1 oligopeptide/dipeptide ABC transporter, ATPase subunit [Natranaerobius thermophilus JW/NM-WN-LF]
MQEAVNRMPEAGENILEVNNLKKHFPVRGGLLKKVVGHVKAVDGVSFNIKRGQTLGLVGESGCGKSTTGRTILRLLEKTQGEVFYQGQDVYNLNKHEMKNLRQKMQIIFQDPYSSLNPRLNVSEIVGESLKEHGIARGKELRDRVKDAIEKSGLQGHHVRRYPHEFSGGQRQRIGIARALALNPEFIVADEPVSALDVSIQSQILNLMMDLQEEMGLTYLFIAHDLGVVKHISDRIGVMYLGNLVELADKKALFDNPHHPYTRALLSAIPPSHPRNRGAREQIVLKGTIPSPANPPSGCKFHPRCPEAEERCSQEVPEFKEVAPDHYVECHLY